MQVHKIFVSFLVFWVLLWAPVAAVALWKSYLDTDSMNTECKMLPGTTCFHSYTSADDTTTADSDWFEVSACSIGVSYSSHGDGTAAFRIRQSLDSAGTYEKAWTPDMNYDGKINDDDADITIDDTSGRRGYTTHPVQDPFQKIDVTDVIDSGTHRISATCK